MPRRVEVFAKRVEGHVVLGGPQSSGQEHHIHALLRLAEGAEYLWLVVAHGLFTHDTKSVVFKGSTDPYRIGISHLSDQQFVADRYNFCGHIVRLLFQKIAQK